MKKFPNIDLSTKPQVVFNLDPLMTAFIRFQFKTPAEQKEIIIKRNKREGQVIYSKIYPIEYPEHRPFREHPVTCILPFTKNNQSVLKYRFYTISKMGEEQIQDELESLFHIWVFRFFHFGYKRKHSQCEIIAAILRGLNMRNNAANFDSVKKFDYRTKVREEEDRFKLLLTDCYT